MHVVEQAVGAFCRARSAPAATIAPFGSVGMGVPSRHSDLDVLAILPPNLTRRAFFAAMPRLLADLPLVSDVRKLARAYVPVIKFSVGALAVDLLCCEMAFALPHSSPFTSNLAMMAAAHDPCSITSLNGVRVSQWVVQHVAHRPEFPALLRLVKAWARCHGLYGAAQQFLGGVSWAILVANFLMETPKGSMVGLLQGFFNRFATWPWPKPVLLQPVQESIPGMPTAPCSRMIPWKPSPEEAMPIVTPCFPSMNSAHSVTRHSLGVLVRHFKEAARQIDRSPAGKATGAGACAMRPLGQCLPLDSHQVFAGHDCVLLFALKSTDPVQLTLALGEFEAKVSTFQKSLRKVTPSGVSVQCRIWTGRVTSQPCSPGDLLCPLLPTAGAVGKAMGLGFTRSGTQGESTRTTLRFDISHALREFSLGLSSIWAAHGRPVDMSCHVMPALPLHVKGLWAPWNPLASSSCSDPEAGSAQPQNVTCKPAE